MCIRDRLRGDAHDEFGQQLGEAFLGAGLPGGEPPRRGHLGGEGGGDVLERAVLQQPREEQVAGLDEGEVLVVLGSAVRQLSLIHI